MSRPATLHQQLTCMCAFRDRALQSSVWSDMMEELRFAVRCHGSAKKPKLRRHCSQCGGLDAAGAGCPGYAAAAGAAAGEPSPNGVLLAAAARRPSAEERLHYRRSARVDCDYAVDRRRTSMRSVDPMDCVDRRPSADRYRDPVADSLAPPTFAKV